jgi:cold shock protein
MRSTGTVRQWHAEAGWGVLDSPDTPGGCWAHFSALETTGHAAPHPGRTVEFDREPVGQDGYSHRATRIQVPGDTPGRGRNRSIAFRSTLTITYEAPEPD